MAVGLIGLIRLGRYLGTIDSKEMEDHVLAYVPARSVPEAIDEAFAIPRDRLSTAWSLALPGALESADFDALAGQAGDRRALLAGDVYRRMEANSDIGAESPGRDVFDSAFKNCLECLEFVLKGTLYVYGVKKEIVSLEHSAAREVLDELRSPGCRKFGELWPPEATAGRQAAPLASYVESLLNSIRGKGIDAETCEAVKKTMDRLIAHPRYFSLVDPDRRLEAARPIVMAMAELRKAPGAGSKKGDLLAALALLLYGIAPSRQLLRHMTIYRPGPASRQLQHEHNAVLALGFLLLGKCELALTFAKKAADTASEPEQRAHICLLEGCTHLQRREHARAAAAIEQALRYASSPKARSRVRFYLGLVKYELGEIQSALDCFQAARAEAVHEVDVMAAYANIGACYMRTGDLGRALAAFEDAETNDSHSSRTTMKEIRAVVSGNAGIIYLSMREYGAALDCFRRALRTARECGRYRDVAHHLANIGLVHKGLREFPEAVRHFIAALHYSCSLDYPECARYAHDQALQLLALQGKSGDAARLEREVVRRHPGMASALLSGHVWSRDR